MFVVFLGCNSNKTTITKQQYSALTKNERLIFIHSLLLDNNIIKYNSDDQSEIAKKLAPYNYSYNFIDYILLSSKHEELLDSIIGKNDYTEFLNKAIPTLYFSFSPEKYHSAPDKWKNKATSFLVNHIPYFYSYGEGKFRFTLRNYLMNNIEDQMFMFNFYEDSNNSDSKENLASGARDTEYWYKLANVYIWMTFPFSDFKKLTPLEQGDLITSKMYYAIEYSDYPITEDILSELDRFKTKWAYNSDKFLKIPPFANVQDSNTIISTVFLFTNNLPKIMEEK